MAPGSSLDYSLITYCDRRYQQKDWEYSFQVLTVLPSTLARLPVRAPSLFTTIADLATLLHE